MTSLLHRCGVGCPQVILLDTHAVIWLANDDPALGRQSARPSLHDLRINWRSAPSAFGKLLFWPQRIDFEPLAPPTQLRAELLDAGLIELPLTGDIAMLAVELKLTPIPLTVSSLPPRSHTPPCSSQPIQGCWIGRAILGGRMPRCDRISICGTRRIARCRHSQPMNDFLPDQSRRGATRGCPGAPNGINVDNGER